MELDPQTQQLLDQMNEVEAPPIWDQPLDELRFNFNEMVVGLQTPGPRLKRVEDHDIAGPHGAIPVRIYWPDDTPEGPLPIFMHFHDHCLSAPFRDYRIASVARYSRADSI